jgi:hypothetical protein
MVWRYASTPLLSHSAQVGLVNTHACMHVLLYVHTLRPSTMHPLLDPTRVLLLRQQVPVRFQGYRALPVLAPALVAPLLLLAVWQSAAAAPALSTPAVLLLPLWPGPQSCTSG